MECEIEETPDGVTLTCGNCEHQVEETGVRMTDAVRLRLLTRLCQTCPYHEHNRYVIVED